MIGDVGESERIHIEEPKDGKKRSAEKQDIPQGDRACQGARACPTRSRGDRRRLETDTATIPTASIVHRGYTEDEIHRPDQLTQIEPDDTAGEQNTLDERELEICASRPDDRRARTTPSPSGSNGNREPRNERQHILPPLQPAALPPQHDEQCCGQCRGDGFAEQCAEEKRECKPVVGSPKGLRTAVR